MNSFTPKIIENIGRRIYLYHRRFHNDSFHQAVALQKAMERNFCQQRRHLQLCTIQTSPRLYFTKARLYKEKKSSSLQCFYCSHEDHKKDGSDEQISNAQSLSVAARLKEAVIKVIPRKKEKLKGAPISSKERNFLTPVRAMTEFMLKPDDLENLRKTKRRSPFENEPPITVYWRKDVEAKALEVWGGLEILEKERKKREANLKQYQEHLSKLKTALRSYEKKQGNSETPDNKNLNSEEIDTSGKVVWAAVVVNGINFVMKLGAWIYTGSHCLFAEALHSLADVTNQLILAYGLRKSQQGATTRHPYGYTTMPYVSSLISGAMIFCIGSGLSFQHGISGLMHPTEIMSLYWAFFTLGGSLLTEGGTLLLALQAIRKGARRHQMTFTDYVLRGHDPSVNVVLLEDLAAVLGVGVALGCMSLTSVTGSHIPDALGSCIIGGILAGVSGFIIYSNTTALVGRSIPQRTLDAVNNELEADVMIRAIYDVKGIDMGSGYVRYKAEVDFDGRELTRGYLNTQDMEALVAEVKQLNSPEEIEEFLLSQGENIIDCLGAEVDRIEKILKKHHPEIRHCDLEIL